MADLTPEIEKSAKEPARVTVDGNTAQGRSVNEQIEADRYLNSKEAARKKGLGVKLTKLVPPGTQ